MTQFVNNIQHKLPNENENLYKDVDKLAIDSLKRPTDRPLNDSLNL